MENVNIYISVLLDSLHKKMDIMKKILQLTKEQTQVLDAAEVDADRFDNIVSEKAVQIDEMIEIDNGFESLYNRIGTEISDNRQQYKPEILEMQNYIRTITDIGVELEALEQQNKSKFNQFLKTKRDEISEFKVSNKVAVSYYQNMANQHREWESHFVDRRK